jgi:RNA recognition motif-containing protein
MDEQMALESTVPPRQQRSRSNSRSHSRSPTPPPRRRHSPPPSSSTTVMTSTSRDNFRDRDPRDRDREPYPRSRDRDFRDRGRDPRERERERIRDNNNNREVRERVISGSAQKGLFIANLERDDTEQDLVDCFAKYGKIVRLEKKNQYAFVWLENDEITSRALAECNNTYLHRRSRRKMVVEMARQDGSVRKRENDRADSAHYKPNETLFVANFDADRTRDDDLRSLFTRYGPIVRANIPRGKNFGFVQFEQLPDAVDAKNAMNNAQWLGRTLSVEYVTKRSEEVPPGGRSSSIIDDRQQQQQHNHHHQLPHSSTSRPRSRSRSRDRDPYRRRDRSSSPPRRK